MMLLISRTSQGFSLREALSLLFIIIIHFPECCLVTRWMCFHVLLHRCLERRYRMLQVTHPRAILCQLRCLPTANRNGCFGE